VMPSQARRERDPRPADSVMDHPAPASDVTNRPDQGRQALSLRDPAVARASISSMP
jgi:hypothetical protein